MSVSKIPELILKLDTSSDKIAEKIIKQILVFRTKAVPQLMRAAQDETKPRIRKWSLQALGAIGDNKAAPLLIDALNDERMTVRFHALKGLGRMKYKKGSKKIATLLNDPSGGVRVSALHALMNIGDSSTGPQIQKSLSDPQWYVRQIACEACGQFSLDKAKKKLQQLSKSDERKAVRTAALEALSKFKQRMLD